MQDGVYARKIISVEELKQCISDEWNKIDQQLIDSAIKQWRKRIAASKYIHKVTSIWVVCIKFCKNPSLH